MRGCCLVLALSIVSIVNLPQRFACAQAVSPYDECRALILATAKPEGDLGSRVGRLMDAGDYQGAMDMMFERAKKWKTVESEVWDHCVEYPSTSMSILWEAAVARTAVWLAMTRSAMYHQRGLNDMAAQEDRMTALKSEQYNAGMKSAQSVADNGIQRPKALQEQGGSCRIRRVDRDAFLGD